MKEFSPVMALVDYVPVILFLSATVILIRDMYNKMSKGAFALFAAGTIDIIAAGFLKATYKLLYALSICDFTRLSDVFFPMQSLGFMLSGVGVLAILLHRQTPDGTRKEVSGARYILPGAIVIVLVVLLSLIASKGNNRTEAPEYFSGTFVFVTLMVLGLAFMDTGLSIMSLKLKKPGLIALFVVSFISSLCMGYLSSRDFDSAAVNWAAECVNIIGQLSLLLASLSMHRNGFESLRLRDEEVA